MEIEKVLYLIHTISFFVVGMRIRRKIGPKGQIVIPKVIREHLGIMPGDEVIMEVRERDVVISAGVSPEDFVEDFCSIAGKKLSKKVDLERLLELEAEERFALR